MNLPQFISATDNPTAADFNILQAQLRDALTQIQNSVQVVPVGGVIPAYLTAAQVSSYFDSTGRGLSNLRWSGYALCNGNNGTPNLDAKFPLWSTAAAGTTGGEDTNSHTHSDAHTHTMANHTHSEGAHTHPLSSNGRALIGNGSNGLQWNAGGVTTDSGNQYDTGMTFHSGNGTIGSGSTTLAGATDSSNGSGTGQPSTNTTDSQSSSTTGSASDTENRPAFSSIVPVMRIL
jgi:hypothetical protein